MIAKRILDLVTFIAAMGALGLAIASVRSNRGPAFVQAIGEPTPFERWSHYETGGQLIGDPSATVRIIEFGDYECPACRTKHGWIEEMLGEFDPDVALEYRHYPLSYHQAAYPAAKAAECAARQGRFEEYHNLLMHEDGWLVNVGQELPRLARVVKIPDPSAFDECFTDTSAVSSIEEDIKMGKRLRIRGTPTFLMDGLDLSTVDADGLRDAIHERLSTAGQPR